MRDLQQILFLDIETVSQYSDYNHLPKDGQYLWTQKTAYLFRRSDQPRTPDEYARMYAERAAIYAEFGKIIVISTGHIRFSDNGPMLRIQSFWGHDEPTVLTQFAAFLRDSTSHLKGHLFCGHNIREFDIPYLCRRMTVHQIPIPAPLNISGKKPWEVKHILDTLELWKFGDYKNFTSLNLLTHVLRVASPKDDLDGSRVGHTYWHEDDLESVRIYCERDVVAVTQVYLRLQQLPLLDTDQIVKVSPSVTL